MLYHTETDKINALTKLLRHRIVAAELRKRPELVGHALDYLARDEQQNGRHPSIDEWRELLQLPLADICRKITARTEKMEQLRLDSPFMVLSHVGLDFTDETERRRIYKIGRRLAERNDENIIIKPR